MDATLRGIVKIGVEDNSSRGTGFIVRILHGEAAQAQSAAAVVEILTALHVVANIDESSSDRVVWLGEWATVQFEGGEERIVLATDCTKYNVEHDWALLQIRTTVPDKLVALRLARLEKRNYNRRWSTFGFSDVKPDGEMHSGDIELEMLNTIHLYSKQAAAGSGGFVSGCSGGPCIVEGHVVGIVIQALQHRKRESVHGAMYALPIGWVADACGLPLAPGPQEFEAKVEAAFAKVRGAELQHLATKLDVPHSESEDGLRLRSARALLLADHQTVHQVLAEYADRISDPLIVAEMVLTRVFHAEAVAIVRTCFHEGVPKGVATVAAEELTVRLLVARALGFGLLDKFFTFIDNRACTRETWSARIREALLGILRCAPDEVENDDDFKELLKDWGGAILAFRFDAHTTPLLEIERYPPARGLAMLTAEDAATSICSAGYMLARALDGAEAERSLKSTQARAVRFLSANPKR